MKELEIPAVVDNLDDVISFVNEELEEMDCPMRDMYQIDVCVEEIYANIVNYAYSSEPGNAIIRVETMDNPRAIVLTFLDRGTPFDPLSAAEPDVTSGAEERKIGGLGIYIVKKSMDEVRYEYTDGQNVLTIRKNF